MKELELGASEKTNQRWRDLVLKSIKNAKKFEIHCWNEEQHWIHVASKYGDIQNSDWQFGTVICGEVTDAFLAMLMQLPKPEDTEIYQKMTPFFSIFFDNGFSSEHYGTELHWLEPQDYAN